MIPKTTLRAEETIAQVPPQAVCWMQAIPMSAGNFSTGNTHAGTSAGNSILFICAEADSAAHVELVLREVSASALRREEALFDGLRALQEGSFDLIVTDLFLPDGQGLATLRHLQQHAPQTPVIALVRQRDRDTGVTAVRQGAYDFFAYEDLDPGNLRKSINGALKHASSEAEKKAAAERRNNARFPIPLAVSYQTLEHPILSGQGTSETLNISSKGLLFTSNEQFQAGQLVQVSLDWPARLENSIPLKLVAEGRIVRNANGQTAMTIDKYEFRTRRVPKTTAPADIAGNRTAQNRPSEAVAKDNITRPGTAAGGKNSSGERRN
jgi:DNA-binding NarL/FixJ family response regulator